MAWFEQAGKNSTRHGCWRQPELMLSCRREPKPVTRCPFRTGEGGSLLSRCQQPTNRRAAFAESGSTFHRKLPMVPAGESLRSHVPRPPPYRGVSAELKVKVKQNPQVRKDGFGVLLHLSSGGSGWPRRPGTARHAGRRNLP